MRIETKANPWRIEHKALINPFRSRATVDALADSLARVAASVQVHVDNLQTLQALSDRLDAIQGGTR